MQNSGSGWYGCIEKCGPTESGNDADEMRETIGGVAFLVGAPLLLMVLMLLAVAHQELLTKVARALGL